MAINIKSSRAEELARAVAARTGESLTTAVTVALEHRLRELDHAAGPPDEPGRRAEEILRLGRAIAAALPEDARTCDHGAVLYDDRGLPT